MNFKKSGAQRRKEKRAAELLTCADDPKQRRISFGIGSRAGNSSNTADRPNTDNDNGDRSDNTGHSPSLIGQESNGGTCTGAGIIHEDSLPISSDGQNSRTSCTIISSERDVSPSTEPTMKGDVCFQRLSISAPVNERLALVNNISQPSNKAVSHLPFDGKKVYERKLSENKYVNRLWISVKVEDRKVIAIFCNVYLAFSDIDSTFTKGFTRFSHIYQSIEEHECSKSHNNAVTAYLGCESKRDIGSLINKEMSDLRRRQVLESLEVLKRIVEVIKFIGKQGLSYRAHRNETLCTLEDRTAEHGNFLELILLLAQFDVPLSNHLVKAIKASEERREKLRRKNKPSSCGRGSLVTMLSKSTVNKIIDGILFIMKNAIVDEIGGRKYSVQMDGSQDVSVADQETIILRYVLAEDVKERLFSVKRSTDTSGSALYQLLKEALEKCGLKMENIIGESFDGVANLRSESRGVQKFIKEDSPNSVYIWCYAHVLNLCATDVVQNILPIKNFIGLLQSTAVFISDSSKRMTIWTEVAREKGIGPSKLKRLQKIGETRWWSKQAALEKILGDFNDPEVENFYVLLQVFLNIKESPKFDAKATFEVDALLQKWCQFETVLTAFLLLNIYTVLRQASEYLQTQGIDYLSAWRMVESAKEKLTSSDFETIYKKASLFVKEMNDYLLENDVDEIEMETEFRHGRVSKKKLKSGELAKDSRPIDPVTRFRSEVFRAAIDQIKMSIDERFLTNKKLITDTACLDPRRFKELELTGIPEDSLNKIAQLTGLKASQLRSELSTFVQDFGKLSRTLKEEFQQSELERHGEDSGKFYNSDSDDKSQFSDEIDEDNESEAGVNQFAQQDLQTPWIPCIGSCRNCLKCSYKILYRYSLNASAYTNLFQSYEYLLTLSFTQVSYERAFSKLKIVKTRLRSTLTDERLEPLMLMCCEKDILNSVRFEDIVEYLCKDSSVYTKMLRL